MHRPRPGFVLGFGLGSLTVLAVDLWTHLQLGDGLRGFLHRTPL
ncbi:hypothetical protein [Nocardioides lijunqiniae]|nr:hypothetical protein [Nocardioides lijunqiniae]